jgi:hypothetical protein
VTTDGLDDNDMENNFAMSGLPEREEVDIRGTELIRKLRREGLMGLGSKSGTSQKS